MSKRFCIIGLISCACFSVQAQTTVPQFKEGERVVFVGNSITHGGHYHSFIWLYYMTRFPNMPVRFYNAGIGGECAWDIYDRLEYDVFDKRPTYITLTFGMNDTGYDIYWKENASQLSQERIDKSLGSYKKIEDRLLAANEVTKVLIGGSPYDETACVKAMNFHGKNDAIRKIIEAQKQSALSNGWGFVDFNAPMREISLREQQKDSTFTFCSLDRVHPDNDGQMVMAYLFLKAQGLSGQVVANISIDSKKKKVLVSENCTISNLTKKGDSLSFDYLAGALPYPLDRVSRSGWGNKRSQKDAMELVPFMDEFNQETLQVKGLDEGSYLLTIDEEEIDTLSSQDLEAGINLAVYNTTPQYQQALKIMFLNEERFEVEKRIREYMWTECTYLKKEGLLFANNQEANDKLCEYLPKDGFLRASYQWYTKARFPEIREIWNKYIDNIVEKIYEINKPVDHIVCLKKTEK